MTFVSMKTICLLHILFTILLVFQNFYLHETLPGFCFIENPHFFGIFYSQGLLRFESLSTDLAFQLPPEIAASQQQFPAATEMRDL